MTLTLRLLLIDQIADEIYCNREQWLLSGVAHILNFLPSPSPFSRGTTWTCCWEDCDEVNTGSATHCANTACGHQQCAQCTVNTAADTYLYLWEDFEYSCYDFSTVPGDIWHCCQCESANHMSLSPERCPVCEHNICSMCITH